MFGIELTSLTLREQYRLVFFGRVQRALELIDRYDPRRLDRIRRDVRAIGGVSDGMNHYEEASRTIVLSLPAVLWDTPAELALTIVHEATHGRISDRGIRYYLENRDRIEAACVHQEVAFASTLPGGEVLAEAMLKKLETPWWSDEAIHEGELRLAEAEEMPRWYLRLLEWHARRRRSSDASGRGEQVR